MQLQTTSGAVQSEGCQLKVTIEFADENKRVFLNQMPLHKEALEAIKQHMPTEAVAQMQQEQKLKQMMHHLQKLVGDVLASCLQTELYQGTQILCNFSVIELDQDIVMAMVNAMAVALLHSPLKCRCLPVAVAVQVLKDGAGYVVDPSVSQLSQLQTVAHKGRLIFNVDTEELLASSIEQLAPEGSLSLEQVEEIISLGLASAKKVHRLILKS